MKSIEHKIQYILKPIPMVFHIRPDFDVTKTPDLTLLAKFVGRKNPAPRRS